MFSFDTSFDDQLVPAQDQWPVFDEVVMCTLSPFSSSSSLSTSPSVQSDALPSVSTLADMSIPPSRSPPRNKDPNHIPRPRNAFMLFRSAFAAAQKISANIEHDNRHITRIIAHCWNRLSEADKQIWRDKAAAEKAQHAQRYPHYRFSPVGRVKKPKKRRVHRNGEKDLKRCSKVADLVMEGKSGVDLERAMVAVDMERDAAERPAGVEVDVFTSEEKSGALFKLDLSPQELDLNDVQPFRSPLLPPAKTTSDEDLMPQVSRYPILMIFSQCNDLQLLVTTTVQTFSSPTVTETTTPEGGDLQSLFHSPYRYYLPDNSPSPTSRAIPPTHYQSVLAFVPGNQNSHAEREQSNPDFPVFSWNQYYN